MNKGWKPITAALALWVSPPAHALPDACDDGFGTAAGDVTFTDDSHAEFQGAAKNDYFGKSLAVLDFNGDGTDDLLVGANGVDDNGSNSGGAYIFFGPIGAVGVLSASTADVVMIGQGFNEKAGWSVANGGDVDNDGDDDALIGSAAGINSTNLGGVAYLVGGGVTGLIDLDTQRTAVMVGAVDYSLFGAAVAGAGDVNGDGFADVLVGAPDADINDTNDGTVSLFLGPLIGEILEASADATFIGATKTASTGTAIAGIGDANGDGYDDFVIGAPRDKTAGSNAGAAYLILGDAAGVAGSHDVSAIAGATYTGAAYDRLGSAVSPAGDVNGDGYDDFFVGAKQQGALKQGAVYVIAGSGAPSGGGATSNSVARITGEDANDLLGSSVAGGVDMNGDGDFDFVAGGERADGAATQSGAAYFVYGPLADDVDVADADSKVLGTAFKDFLGASVAMGDVNGDGYGDAIVGSWRMSTAKTRGGSVAIFLGGEDTADVVSWYADSDVDGFGNASSSTQACEDEPPAGFVSNDTDCNDASNVYYPGAPEGCADPDYNCDGFQGNVDSDGDGYGACEDCDDGDSSVNPDGTEVCGDAIDNDCDGLIDDASASDALTWAPDLDADGYGREDLAVVACDDPGTFLVNLVNLGGDCDDGKDEVNPDGVEICDGVDNNCDGEADESTALDAASWYLDFDVDGYGDFETMVKACDQPLAYVNNGDDCDDLDSLIVPGAVEVCDFADNDCDGLHYKGGPTPASDRRASFVGRDASERLGDAVGFLGDQDGDGDDELVIGGPQSSEGANEGGVVYVFPGSTDGGDIDFTDVLADGTGPWSTKIIGTRPGVFLGSEIDSADLNGDGVDDLILGAYGARVSSYQQGAVYVFFGPIPAGDHDAEAADLILKGPTKSDRFGFAVDVLDYDCDGVMDLAASAPLAKNTLGNEGAVYLLKGGANFPSGSVSVTTAANAMWFSGLLGANGGESLGSADIDADGCDDLWVGTPAFDDGSGQVDIFYGMAGTLDATGSTIAPTATMTHAGILDEVGRSLSGAGDVNGDGYDDFVVGTTANEAWLVWGSATRMASGAMIDSVGVRFEGGFTQRLGETAVGIGDANGDGYDDIVISGHRDGDVANNSGAALLVYGGTDFDLYLTDDDTVLANEIESQGRLDDGTTFPTFSASNLEYIPGAKLLGAAEGDQFGTALAGGGDYNGDGTNDVMVGAPRADYDQNTLDSGRAYVFTTGIYGVDFVENGAGADALSATTKTTYYTDADADQFADDDLTNTFVACPLHAPTLVDVAVPADSIVRGIPVATATTDCTPVAPAGSTCDCDDDDAESYPGATEENDDVDHDCDGYADVNDNPTIDVDLTPNPAVASDTLTATATSGDANGDTVTITYAWFVNDVALCGETTNTLLPSAFTKGDTVRVDATADDGRAGTTVDSDELVVSNTPPVLTECQVNPALPGQDSELTAIAAGLSDDDLADAGLLTVAYQWQQRFGPIWSDLVGETTTTLASCIARGDTGPSGGQCVRGTRFRVECTPSDPDETGLTYASGDVTIMNTAPSVDTCTLSPTSPTTLDPITLTLTATDADNDTIVTSQQWEVDGVIDTTVTGLTYPISKTSHFEVIRAICTANDGTEAGDAGYVLGQEETVVNSATVTVVNTLPTVVTIDLTPNAPLSEEALTVTITGASTDVDVEDTITYNYYWTVNGAPFNNPTYPSTSSGLNKTSTVRGQLWEVTVAPHDGTAEGPSDSDSVEIQNTPPTMTGIVITPGNPITSDDIQASVQGWYDEDGDPELVTVQWFVDAVEVVGDTDSIMASSNHYRGQDVFAIATAQDPFDSGSSSTSNTITTVNATPSAPVLNITPNPPGEFDDMTCNIGTASYDPDSDDPASADTVSYAYNWYSDTGKGPVAGSVLAEANTDYGETWYCTALPTDSTGADGDLGTSPTIAIQDLDAPPAPSLDSRERYRNSTSVTMSGTCLSGVNECNSVRVDCADGLGSLPSQSVACSGNAFVTSAFALTRGQTTTCAATCVDIGLNESLGSNGITTDSCSPEDTYEGGFGSDSSAGDSAGAPTDGPWSLPDTASSTLQFTGNIVDVDSEDWFKVTGTNSLAADRSAGADAYNFKVVMAVGAGHYRMQTYRDQTATRACPSDANEESYNHYWSGQRSANNCAPENPSAGSTTVAQSQDHCHAGSSIAASHIYYMRVLRDATATDSSVACNYYRLDVNNGTAKP